MAKLPDFSTPSRQKQKAISTGTDNVTPTDWTYTGQNEVQRRILANPHEQRNRVNNIENAVSSEADVTRTRNLRIDSPML